MNILIVANHWAVCSARYAADAFTRLGHTVKHVGRPMGRDIWGMQVPEEYVWTPDDSFTKERVDLVIFMDSDSAILDLGEKYRQNLPPRVPVVVWGVDNHVRDYRRPYFDHYFLAHKSVSVMEWREWEESWVDGSDWSGYIEPHDMTHLPCAYDPIAFSPSPIAWEQREYDVCMVGVMYPKRWELVNAMRAAGLKVFAGTGLVYDAYRDAHHNSRVALVSSFNGDLPIRLFEGAGMGCAVLTDPIEDLKALDPKGLNVYSSPEIAVSIAKMLVRDGGSSGQSQAHYSQAWAVPHTWDARAQVIIDWLEARS
jgi:hypothetical protein